MPKEDLTGRIGLKYLLLNVIQEALYEGPSRSFENNG
jgi:hypothetical protein